MAEESISSLASSTPYKSKKLCVEEIVVSSKKLDESELEEGELRDSRLTNTTVNDYTFRSTSWVELLEENSNDMQVRFLYLLYVRVCYTELSNARFICFCLPSRFMKRFFPQQRSSNAPDTGDSQSQGSYTREIAIEIFDASNEAKFDRLLKEDKIKSPFRRHPSNDTIDEAAKAELLKHNPSILDFEPRMSASGAPAYLVSCE